MVEEIGAEFMATETESVEVPSPELSSEETFNWIYCSVDSSLSPEDRENIERAIQSDVDLPVLFRDRIGVFSRSQFYKDMAAGIVSATKVVRCNRLTPLQVVTYLKKLRVGSGS